MRDYKKNNQDKIKKYYIENKEKYREYRENKREITILYMKDYYSNNLDKRKKYLEENKESFRVKRNISEKKRRDGDSLYRLKIYVRNRIWFYLKKNPLLVDCSYAYPENWSIPFERKIIQRDKNSYGGYTHLRGQ
jgi:hypothetical protein